MNLQDNGSASPVQLLADLERERERTELRSRFLSLVSHEFRTPLTVILSSCELLQSYGDGWSDIRRQSHFHRIQASVANMTALLDNVSLLAKFDSGRYILSTDSVSMEQVMLAVSEETGPFRSRGQELTTFADPGLDAFLVDSRLLRAATANLVANALRFSPEGSTVHVSARPAPGGLEIVVLDRGSGIPPGEESLIWEPFERGANSRGVPGSGLGLAIVRRCVELAGGTATLHPREGGGLEARAFFPSMDPP